MAKTRTYFCIDMKSFYASVECAERGYNPFETNLVVADLTRGKNALCLAITPAMKAQGIRNRCRLSEIPSNVKYEVAPPRMALYIEYAADIYSLYLDYFDPRDIHVYSIDESFLDVTDYLAPKHMDAVTFAKHLMNEIADRFHIPATAGIGTNLYLAKIALDLTDHVGGTGRREIPADIMGSPPDHRFLDGRRWNSTTAGTLWRFRYARRDPDGHRAHVQSIRQECRTAYRPCVGT